MAASSNTAARRAHDEVQAARDFLQLHRCDAGRAQQGFRWPRVQHFNFALDWIDTIGRERDREALRVVDVAGVAISLRFSDLSRSSDRLANFLRCRGVARGDAVLLMADNTVVLWDSFLALMKLGAVIIPTTTLLSASELRERMARGAPGGVRFVMAAAECHDRFEPPAGWQGISLGGSAPGWHDARDAAGASTIFGPDGTTAADDPLLLYFTSGTTAQPKLVRHSHVSYPIGHLSTMYWLGLQPGDLHLNISSPGWAKHAWSCIFAPWLAEATVLVLDHPRFDARATLATIAHERVTTFCAPPTVWRMLVQHDLAACKTNLRELASAGEPLNPEVIDRVQRGWGLCIRDGFGQTETSALIGNSPGQTLTPGAVGRPLPGFDIALLDDDDRPAAEGEISICLSPERPIGLMAGYAADGVHTIAGTHYRTGDIARRTADGAYIFVGRVDDVFKASDYRISPFELESALIAHPAVLEAAVVPSPDPVRMAVPKAFVALVADAAPTIATARDILAYANLQLGPFKRIRKIEFLPLPKTVSGKIRRAELRKTEASRVERGETGPTEWHESDLAE